MTTNNTVSGLFANINGETHSLSLRLVEDCGVWQAAVGSETRYFEAPVDAEIWNLLDSAVHCYEVD